MVKIIIIKGKILEAFLLKIRNKTTNQLSPVIVLEYLASSERHEIGTKSMTMKKKRHLFFALDNSDKDKMYSWNPIRSSYSPLTLPWFARGKYYINFTEC